VPLVGYPDVPLVGYPVNRYIWKQRLIAKTDTCINF
jgi:hypothetical protein